MTPPNVSTMRSLVIALLLLVAAFVLRVDYRSNAVDEYALRADARQYFVIAINLFNYGTFSSTDATDGPPKPDSYRGPLYPLVILGMLQGAGADDPADVAYRRLLFWQAVVGAITVALVFFLGRVWLPSGLAIAAAVLCAVWPLLITLSGLALTETLFGGLLVLAVLLQVHWLRTGKLPALVAAGLAWGACILLNTVALPLPVLLGFIVSASRPARLVLFLAIALGPQMLWSVRNVIVIEDVGRMTLSARLLENVLIGMEPDFNDYYQRPDEPQGYAARGRVVEQMDAYSKGEQSALSLVVGRMTKAPAEITAHLLTKPWEFWRWGVEQGHGGAYVYRMLYSPFEASAFYRGIATLTFWINPLLFMLAMVPCIHLVTSARARQWAWKQRAALLVLTVVVYATAVHTVLTPDARYAAPFRPFQFLVAGWGAWILAGLVLRRLGRGEAAEGVLPSRSAN